MCISLSFLKNRHNHVCWNFKKIMIYCRDIKKTLFLLFITVIILYRGFLEETEALMTFHIS